MSILKSIFGLSDHESPEDNVILLAKMKFRDGSDGEERVIVKRREVQTTCEAFDNRPDVAEIWVFQKIYHHRKEFPTDEVVVDESPMLANATIGVMKA